MIEVLLILLFVVKMIDCDWLLLGWLKFIVYEVRLLLIREVLLLFSVFI